MALKALRKDSVKGKGDERVLGDSDFVETVLREADEHDGSCKAVKASQPAVSIAVRRGEKIAGDNGFTLMEN